MFFISFFTERTNASLILKHTSLRMLSMSDRIMTYIIRNIINCIQNTITHYSLGINIHSCLYYENFEKKEINEMHIIAGEGGKGDCVLER